MSPATKTLARSLTTSKLEIERKFVPTPLLTKHAQENPRNETLTLHATQSNTTTSLALATLSRLPRKRIIDKYFDRNGQLERKGIWVRWRREQTTAHDGTNAAETNGGSTAADGFWEAKVKQGGDFVNSRFTEVKGRDAVEGLMKEAGVCDSVFDLKFELGFMADRVSWAVKESGQEGGDDAVTLTLVLDSMLASLEGADGSHPKYMQHRVGELEFEKTIANNNSKDDVPSATDSKNLATTQIAESNAMNAHLENFMFAHPAIFAGEGTPKGKLTSYIEQKRELAARDWKANASGRFANMSEVKYKRLFGGK